MRNFCHNLLLLGLCISLASASQIKYSTVTGFFLQDLNTTNTTTFDYSTQNLGLINQAYDSDKDCPNVNKLTQWQKFEYQLAQLNHKSSKNIEYKLLYLGRHGEGWHNAAETFYGTPAWNCYWAELDGNASASWVDAKLTANGIAQAQKAHNFWANAISVQRIPTPNKFYTSPLSRCLATANITFTGLNLPKKKKFVPVVKEYLREGMSIHTCNWRSNKTYIQNTYPGFKVESGFSEFDNLWNGVTSETSTAQDLRSKALLDDIFSSEKGSYHSCTSHSGEVASLLRVLGHIPFSLSTGAIIPVLVKAEILSGSALATSATWTASAHCTVPPVTSISNGACVCPSSAAPVTTPLVLEQPTVSPSFTFVASTKAF
ncbi:phosphoglycerate mutase-like protein [Tothia fuscella]|uniref:Phosphoglycerate mutase-like protein n=1 Tax=Tothia fuscella TaxID=1048955 RepID=A0A9P4TVP4_9PEZI|nr:phosphoglycerate mutase-like protein [Tothia fuscella]